MTALYIFTDSEIKHTQHTLTIVCFLEIKENLREISWQMFMSNKNNSSSLSDHEEAACSTVSSVTRVQDFAPLMAISSISEQLPDHKIKKRRNLPGNPDPDAEVIALSPKTLMATNRFVCEICKKGFQRDQNLQLHRRGHNLPWKLKQRNSKEMIKKKAYVCPEPTCVHNHPSRALGDLTGIKKHFCRKHGEKKWKCEKCSKIYAVQSDWKAHSKTCGTREYRCDCGTLFSRKDSFVTHRAFCDALAEESARLSAAANPMMLTSPLPLPLPPSSSSSSSNPTISQSFTIINQHSHALFPFSNPPPPQIHLLPSTNSCWDNPNPNPIKPEIINPPPLSSPFYHQQPTHKNLNLITSPFLHVGSSQSTSSSAHLSATALLQRAATVGAQPVGHVPSSMMMGELSHVTSTGISPEYMGFASATWQKSDRLTRDFLGLTASEHGNGGGQNGNVDVDVNVRNLLTFTGGVGFPTYDRDHSLLKSHGFGFAEPPPPPPPSETWGNC